MAKIGGTIEDSVRMCYAYRQKERVIFQHFDGKRVLTMSKYPIQAQVLSDMLSLRGMARNELARRTGLSPTAITYYCNGQKMMSLLNAAKIARTLDVSLEYLATGDAEHDVSRERLVSEEEFSLVQAFRTWMEDSRIESKMSRHLFLRGVAGAGKSKEIRKAVISHLEQVGGFYVQHVYDGGQILGVALNPVRDDFEYVLAKEKDADNVKRMFVFRKDDGWEFDGDVYEQYGVKYLRDNLDRQTALTVLDETGGLELLCTGFRTLLYKTLDATPCIGAVKSMGDSNPVWGFVRQMQDAAPAREEYLRLLSGTHNTKFLDLTADNVEKTRHKVAQFVNANLHLQPMNPPFAHYSPE